MEKQMVSVFRQKNRWGLTALSIVLCVVLSPLLGISLALPQAIMYIPVLLMLLLSYVGPVSSAVAAGIVITLGYFVFGALGGVCAALFLLPALIVSAYLVDRRFPFWKSVAVSCVTVFGAACAVIALLTFAAGSDVVTAICSYLREGLAISGRMGDSMLNMFVQMGVLTQPDGYSVLMSAGILTDAVREELTRELMLMMDTALRLELPNQMVVGAFTAGLFGQALLRRGMRARGENVDYEPVRTWHIPGGWGRVLMITLAALYLMAMTAPAAGTSTFYVFSGLLDQALVLQGVAALLYLLHIKGKGKLWRIAVFVLGCFFMRPLASVIGVMDQGMDITHRREKLGFPRVNVFGGFMGGRDE